MMKLLSFLIYFPIFTFICLRLPYITTQLYFPDELWHTSVMENANAWINSKESFFAITNYQGFGATYWFIGRIFANITSDFRLLLRIIALFAIIFSSLIYTRYFKDKIDKFVLTLFFLSFPFFWYGGKIITPEFYTLPLIFLSYVLTIFRSRIRLPYFFLGFSFGIKASILPAIIPVLIFSFSSKSILVNKKNILISGLIFLLGFFVASPNIIWEPANFYQNMPGISFSWNTFQDIFDRARAWDLVLVKGFNLLAPLSTLILLALIFWKYLKRKEFISFFLSVSFYICLMLFNGKLIWHFYSIVPIFLFYLLLIYKDLEVHSKRYFLNIVISICLIVNIFTINSFLSLDYQIRFKTYNDIVNFKDKNTECLIQKINDIKIDNNFLANATSQLATNKGETLVDITEIKNKTPFPFLPVLSQGNDFSPLYNSSDQINIYLIVHKEHMKLNDFQNNFLDGNEYYDNNIINSLIIPEIIFNSLKYENNLDSSVINQYSYSKETSCNNIDLIKIKNYE